MTQHIQPISLYSVATFELWGATSAEWTSMMQEEALQESGPEVTSRKRKTCNRLIVLGAILLATVTVLMAMGTSPQRTVVADQPLSLIHQNKLGLE